MLQKKFYDPTGNEVETIGLKLEVTNSLLGRANTFISNNAMDNRPRENSDLSTYPMPFRSELVFNLPNHENAQAKVFIYDNFGRLALELQKYIAKGDNSVFV